jgi:hypothetical protein
MFVLQGRVHSLADLLEMRAMLRRQDTLVGTALADVQSEIRSWNRHRKAHELLCEPVPRELCMIWEELETRERELALDVLQIRAALQETNAEIQQKLHRPRTKAS